MKRSWWYLAPIGAVVGVVAAVAIADPGGELSVVPPRRSTPEVGVTPRQLPDVVRWLAFGGGVEPGSNQVSIEQDLALVDRLLVPGGVTLFAGGAGRSPVQVEAQHDRIGEAGGLHRRLGDLFWPQEGRSATYRPTTLVPHGDARAETVLDTLLDALQTNTDEPLFVFVAAHGDPGEERQLNLVRLWGGAPISAIDLAELLDELPQPRPLRLVMASCFSGGFAETAFVGASPEQGPTPADRCGLFATTWDAPAAGCDPNPDRRAQESYFVHVLNALEGLDRDGKPIDLDLDGDGRVSLLEAHTRVRIASHSISVPTSTSERWLRHAAAHIDAPPGELPTDLVEEQAVIAALAKELSLGDAAAAEQRLITLHGRARALEDESQDLLVALEVASADLRISLLERWPTLDDAYHPSYRATLATNEAAIRAALDTTPLARAHAAAAAASQKHGRQLDELDVEIAMVRRLLRAYENMIAAAKLRDHDPAAYARFTQFLRCERALPPLKPERHAKPR